MNKEVLQLALDALQYNLSYDRFSYDYIQEVIETLRAELAKPEPETVAWMHEAGNACYTGVNASIKGYTIPLYRKEDV